MGALSELKSPLTKKVTILLANSYWSNVEWAWMKTPSNDLYRELFQQQGKYGARLAFEYAISREDRPESTLGQGRIEMDTIQQAFNVTKQPTGTHDPHVKWLIVGNTDFKQKYYPMLIDLGYDLARAPDDQYSIYYDGQNSLYTKLLRTDDPYLRDKSPMYQYYEELEEEQHDGIRVTATNDVTKDETKECPYRCQEDGRKCCTSAGITNNKCSLNGPSDTC